jgi:hypothetical protein
MSNLSSCRKFGAVSPARSGPFTGLIEMRKEMPEGTIAGDDLRVSFPLTKRQFAVGSFKRDLSCQKTPESVGKMDNSPSPHITIPS